MAEVQRRQKRAEKLIRLGKTIDKGSATATVGTVAVWQKQLDADWADFQKLHEIVMNRAGSEEISEQEAIYDDINNKYYETCTVLAELQNEIVVEQSNSNEELEKKLNGQHAILIKRLDSACDRVATEVEEMTSHQIEILRKNIEQLFKSIEDVSMELMVNGADEEKVFETEKEVVKRYEVAIEALVIANERHNPPAVANNGAAGGPDKLKVPQLQITPFDGRFEKWEAFRESFLHGIHQRTNMPAIQKLQYLKTVLRGPPQELIQNFGLTNDNYATAWKMLNDRYNNQQELVLNHLRVITSLPQCRQSAEDICRVANTTASSLLALGNLGRPVAQWDDWVVFHVIEKIDQESRRMWRQERATKDALATWAELDQFLQGRVRALTADGVYSPAKIATRTQSDKTGRNGKVHAHQATTTPSDKETRSSAAVATHYKCGYCNGNHLITFCQEFRQLSVADRRRMVAEKSLCFICLAKGHYSHQCTSPRKCNTCEQRHNTMLHTDSETKNSVEQTVQAHAVTSSAETRHPRPRVLLTTAIVNVLDAAGEPHQMRAFLDNGSESSFISEHAAQTLRLPRQAEDEELGAIAGVSAGHISQSVVITVSDRHGNDYSATVNALILRRVTDSFKPMPVPEGHRWPHIKGLLLADPEFMKRRRVDILLGGDVFGECLTLGIRQHPGLPTAMNSQFGWLLNGRVPEENAEGRDVGSAIQTFHISIDQQLARFWELEETVAARRLTLDEEKCEAFYEATTTRKSNGRMCVRLPMRNSEIQFGESQRFAVQRQLQIERRFKVHPEFAKQYRAFMAQYQELGHMREVVGAPVDLTRSCKMQSTDLREYYIPHHAIMKETSTTTKLRVVFDASRRTTNGVSLNDQMHIGPRLQEDLTAIMMRWRQYRVAYCADIEKMYRQVDVHSADRDLQRIVWRSTAEEQMKVYQLTTVTYGTASAPYLAIKSLQTLANLESERYPIGARIVVNNFYVDDVLGGADSERECINDQHELIALLASGGLALRKWASNSADVLAQVKKEHRECQLPLTIEDGSSISTLGVQWHPASDEIGVKINSDCGREQWTKRSFLSVASRLYDPLGWLAPCVIVVKILFQSLWKLNLEWDDELPVHLVKQWNDIRSELHQLQKVKISRWIGTTRESVIEVHGFADASMSAFAAVVYVKVLTANRDISIHNICAKTKVAPVKVVSLPRLELCGAVLLVKLIDDVIKAMQWTNVSVYCWTDSTIVLSWLRGHPSQYNVFVANRTAEIQRAYPSEHWHHVASGDNPADYASRGISPRQLLQHNLWWTGPMWLRDPPSAWPVQPTVTTTTEENRVRVHATALRSPCAEMLERYSSLSRLVRVTAWCTRFVYNCRHRKDERRSGILTPSELKQALDDWVRDAQSVAFEDELRKLRNQLPIYRILRVGGRLANANEMTESARSPAIIPRRSRLSALIVKDAHERTLHGGPALMLAFIRRSYWIVDGPNEVRRYVKR